MPRVLRYAKVLVLPVIALAIAALPVRAQSLSVNLSANAVNFNLTRGSATNPGSGSITATTVCTACLLQPVNVYAYFSNANSALSSSGNNIPSSAFQISTNGGPFRAVNNSVAFGGAGAGLQISNFFVLIGPFGGTHSDTLTFNIDLSGGTLPNLPPGNYTGTLTIRAQAP